MKSMVEVRQATKRFGSFVALDDVSLDIREGEFMTFLGPSGCGKTTCLRLISGFERPTVGRVILDGQDVTDQPPYQRDVNQVFQSYALFPHLNIFDNIAFGLRMKKLPQAEVRQRVNDVMAITSLTGYDHRRPSQLSGGQRQRVALARAIVCRPKVLLLDEPLSALDAKLRHQMQIELKRLQKKLGITFIFVTHDQEEALTMSDRIAVLNLGKLEQIGSSWEIYHRPSTKFVASFIGDTNIVEAEVLGPDRDHILCRAEGGLLLRIGGNQTFTSNSILISLRPEKITLSRQKPTGDNVFRAVIESEIFKGATDELVVRTDGELELSTLSTNDTREESDLAPGETVYCRLHPEDITILSQT